MATEIEIANMALAYVGDEPIASLTGGTDQRSRAVSLFFTSARRRALRLASWNCSSKRRALNAEAGAPVWGFTHQYRLPEDYIRLVAVQDAGAGYQYEIENGFINTDLGAPLYIKYVYDDTVVTRFDPLLTTVFAYCLAIDMCEILADDTSKKSELNDSLMKWLNAAKSVDGLERPPQEIQHTSWLTARNKRS